MGLLGSVGEKITFHRSTLHRHHGLNIMVEVEERAGAVRSSAWSHYINTDPSIDQPADYTPPTLARSVLPTHRQFIDPSSTRQCISKMKVVFVTLLLLSVISTISVHASSVSERGREIPGATNARRIANVQNGHQSQQQEREDSGNDVGAGEAIEEMDDVGGSLPVTIRKKKAFGARFPRTCPCKQVKARPGKCYYFLKSKGFKCKSRTCEPRYVCVPKKVAAKLAKKFGKVLLMCIRRVTRKRIVPWIRKGRKGLCKSIRTRRRVFYVPYVRS